MENLKVGDSVIGRKLSIQDFTGIKCVLKMNGFHLKDVGILKNREEKSLVLQDFHSITKNPDLDSLYHD